MSYCRILVRPNKFREEKEDESLNEFLASKVAYRTPIDEEKVIDRMQEKIASRKETGSVISNQLADIGHEVTQGERVNTASKISL